MPEDFKRDLIPKHIKTGGELDEAEEENIADGLVWLEDYSGESVDWMFWLKLHKKMFEKVWKWAGKFRDRELANADFDHSGFVQENVRKLEGDLKYWLGDEAKVDDKECMARFHERLLTIHPFCNGNGRTIRILTEYVCRQKGLTLPTWSKTMREKPQVHRQAYIKAVEKARHDHDFSDLIRFMYG